jgi:hypothetical protein
MPRDEVLNEVLESKGIGVMERDDRAAETFRSPFALRRKVCGIENAAAASK